MPNSQNGVAKGGTTIECGAPPSPSTPLVQGQTMQHRHNGGTEEAQWCKRKKKVETKVIRARSATDEGPEVTTGVTTNGCDGLDRGTTTMKCQASPENEKKMEEREENKKRMMECENKIKTIQEQKMIFKKLRQLLDF